MADSIQLIFTYDDSVDAMVCAEPSYNEVYSFFQDIIHVATPEEAALGVDSLLAIPSYRSSLNVVGIFGPAEVTYRVVDSSQVNDESQYEIAITGTNYWDLFVNGPNGIPPSDFIVYDVTLNTEIEMVSLENCITNPPSPSFGDDTTIEITFYKDDEGSDQKTVPEPEVYPSVARSLDKIIDKMEGNEETYKEAVPSVERSMWKIAELFGNTNNEQNNIESEIVYDDTNVDRFVLTLSGTSLHPRGIIDYKTNPGGIPGGIPGKEVADVLPSSVNYQSLCNCVKTSPFAIDYFTAKINILGVEMHFNHIKSSFAYVDSDDSIHSLISASYGYKNGSSNLSGNYNEALLFGEIVVTENLTADCSGLFAIITSESNNTLAKIVQGTNIICDTEELDSV